jgi:hypothetical protein
MLPHVPQLRSSVCRSTQLVPHGERPAWSQTQALEPQCAAAGQALSQPPQCALLLLVSTQLPAEAHQVWMAPGQRHCPPVQISPVRQRRSQPPQWATSDSVSRQMPADAHHASPGLGQTQALLRHTCPGLHALVQPPQYAGLLVKSTHAPAVSHQVCPAGHLQVDAAQISVARHFVWQSPQCAGSLVVSTQASPQGVRPKLVQPHCPLLQIWPAAQRLPQTPQLAGSSRKTHAPPQ